MVGSRYIVVTGVIIRNGFQGLLPRIPDVDLVWLAKAGELASPGLISCPPISKYLFEEADIEGVLDSTCS